MAGPRQKPQSSPPMSKFNKALREIRSYQRTTFLLIVKAPMQRYIRKIAQLYGRNLHFPMDALLAILEAEEAFLTKMFEEANPLAIHRKRVTVTSRDIGLVRCFMTRHNYFIFNKYVVHAMNNI